MFPECRSLVLSNRALCTLIVLILFARCCFLFNYIPFRNDNVLSVPIVFVKGYYKHIHTYKTQQQMFQTHFELKTVVSVNVSKRNNCSQMTQLAPCLFTIIFLSSTYCKRQLCTLKIKLFKGKVKLLTFPS